MNDKNLSTGLRHLGHLYKRLRLFPLYIVSLIVGIGGAVIAFAIPFILNTPDDQVPMWLPGLIIFLLCFGVCLGIILPVLVMVYRGGETVHKYGGLASLLVLVGMVITGIGLWWNLGVFIIGAIICAVGVVLLIYFGKKSGTPMWLQLPFFGSPKLQINNKPKDPIDKVK